ncbi:MAG: HlyD family efflux transporter periplasmic adaptor subunit [Bacteroidia bacterium]|nr:HlyD family efflux transporter periplasmic adaptor subunit [Bacteroidia bacterium]
MLGISENSVRGFVEKDTSKSFSELDKRPRMKMTSRMLLIMTIPVIIILMLPWTQNVRAYGQVTALKPGQRPQTIQSILPGRIERWYVQEGQFVKKGDTIIFLTEVKDEYFDPKLIERTNEQLLAKEQSVNSYVDKIKANERQIQAMESTLKLKKEQAVNKLKQARLMYTSDSMDLVASKMNLSVAENQMIRMQEMYSKGLKSLTDLESRKLKLQETQAKLISQENKLLSSRNQVLNSQIELSSIEAEYSDKISKTESDKFAAMSEMYDAEAIVTKMRNQYANYIIRSGLYYVTAPQDGYITKAITAGIGETIKEGTEIVSIMPFKYDLAVEVFVRPIDVPLLDKGSLVRVQFDGWPAIVFSGWPNVSYGTYGGRVIAIDRFISENGKYRVLVGPDPNDHQWPNELRVGGGVNTMMLLKEVPVWYELWRQINAFPPEYYKNTSEKTKKK